LEIYAPKILDEKCPLCNSPLVERTNRRGQKFIGCSGYPNCHYIKKEPKLPKNKKTFKELKEEK
jgi:DNA topoisomerase-1